MPQYIVFKNGHCGTVEIGADEDRADVLAEIEQSEETIKEEWHIPYPSSVRLRINPSRFIPSFCRDPTGLCKGQPACPMPRSCVD